MSYSGMGCLNRFISFFPMSPASQRSVSFIPFPTAVFGRYGALPSAAFFYGCVLTALGITYSLLSLYILKRGLRQNEAPHRSSQDLWPRNVLGTVTYPAATVLCLWYPRMGVTIYFLLAAFYLLPGRDLSLNSRGVELQERKQSMSAEVDILNPARPKRIAMVASNPATSDQTGWPIGFWWSELTHPYWEFTERGYHVDIFSPEGGKLIADRWSDPRDESKYSANDLISLGFISSPECSKLVDNSKPIAQIIRHEYDAIFFVGGQGPMYTFYNNDRVHELASSFYRTGKIVAVLCHATCILLKTKLDDKLLVDGKTWTGFANSEETFADSYVGKRIQPFWIEDEARRLPGTNFIVSGRFKAHAVRDGNLFTGQQQFSGAAVARLVIEALGI
jgi:putative intracellular protease/amidase